MTLSTMLSIKLEFLQKHLCLVKSPCHQNVHPHSQLKWLLFNFLFAVQVLCFQHEATLLTPSRQLVNHASRFWRSWYQSLLMVPVMHTQLEGTLSFLEQIPDVSRQSSMVFVLQEWTSHHPSFFGKWETRMSLLAMAYLLSHYLQPGQAPCCLETVSKDVVKPSEGMKVWCSEVWWGEVWWGGVQCSEVRCGEVEYSVVMCVVPSLHLCFHCRYHDTVNEEERRTLNLFHVLTAVPSLPPRHPLLFNYSSITDYLLYFII